MRGEILIIERPMNYDGEPSKTLAEYGTISDEGFWNQIEEIIAIMRQEKLWFFDIFHGGSNIIVQEIPAGRLIPVIIDCKRIGWSSYPFQLNLLLAFEREAKFSRRLEGFRAKFDGRI